MSKNAPVIGTLGTLPFICAYQKVLTFTDLSRDLSARWAKHEVIGKKPVLEYVGPDLASISLKIRFDQSLGAPPLVGLKLLKKMLEDKKSKILVIGGEYLGKFVIESISEERRFHTGAGLCIVAEASINLTESVS